MTTEPSCKDEARVGQKGTVTYGWARCGTRPRAVPDTRYKWTYLFGAVCPKRGVGAGLVMSRANMEGLNGHLVEITRTVTPGAHAVLVMDGADWQKSDDLVVPGNISPLHLPSYAPELNPVENVWQTCVATSSLIVSTIRTRSSSMLAAMPGTR